MKYFCGCARDEDGRLLQPYRIETEARKIGGATFKVAEPFSSYAIQDGNLITGQQQNSGAAAAELLVKALGHLGFTPGIVKTNLFVNMG